MQELWRKIGSPRHLMVFEAAGRLKSFTRAAQELNVQQPAISMAIRQLETSLGVTLFVRHHRRIELTSAGARLHADVSRGLEKIADSAAAIQYISRPEYVTLNASSAFNNYWMMPRLSAFQRQRPDIDLRLQSSDHEPDIDAENISLAVRRGDGNWPNCQASLIAHEIIYPVAAPRVMATAVGLRNLTGLLHQRLIHLEEPVRERPSWADWFAHHNMRLPTPSSGLRLNEYGLVLQAAMAGEGFAFGWHHLVDRLISQELLSGRRDWGWETGKGFYLVWSQNRPLPQAAQLVRDWILKSGIDGSG